MLTRIVSAVVALAIVVALFLTLQLQGLYIVCTAVALACIYEYSRLTFTRVSSPLHLQITFGLLAACIYFVSVTSDHYGFFSLAVAPVVFLSMVMVTVRGTRDLNKALQLQSAGLVGFFYTGLFPALAVKTLYLEPGPQWLFGLMAIVFAGDTFAYLAGRTFGKNKLLEAVSPNKTIEGSVGGLVGSAIAGLILWTFAKETSPVAMVLMAVVTGLFAQVGDLFESLLKRIADVKDSGSIMPGHGGMLDRIDGILFAAPIYYVLTKLLL